MNKRKLIISTLAIAAVAIGAGFLWSGSAEQTERRAQPSSATNTTAEIADVGGDAPAQDRSSAVVHPAPRHIQEPFVPSPSDATGAAPNQP